MLLCRHVVCTYTYVRTFVRTQGRRKMGQESTVGHLEAHVYTLTTEIRLLAFCQIVHIQLFNQNSTSSTNCCCKTAEFRSINVGMRFKGDISVKDTKKLMKFDGFFHNKNPSNFIKFFVSLSNRRTLYLTFQSKTCRNFTVSAVAIKKIIPYF